MDSQRSIVRKRVMTEIEDSSHRPSGTVRSLPTSASTTFSQHKSLSRSPSIASFFTDSTEQYQEDGKRSSRKPPLSVRHAVKVPSTTSSNPSSDNGIQSNEEMLERFNELVHENHLLDPSLETLDQKILSEVFELVLDLV
jgi:hypothetical protein